MKWHCNVRRDRDGRVYSTTHEARAGVLRVVVHRLISCGDEWHLTVHPGLADRVALGTGVADEAKASAEQYVRCVLQDALAELDAPDEDA